jgi:hypothetical protein
MWLVTRRGKMTEDPIIFAIKDKISYVMLLLIIIVLIVAANFNLNI